MTVEKGLQSGRVGVALIHYPVKGRKGETIASAITNLDIHDIARAVRTYGAEVFYIVTPLEDQKALAGKIVSHWQTGTGASYNPDRQEALRLVKIVSGIGDAVDRESRGGVEVKIVATSAQNNRVGIGYDKFRKIVETSGKDSFFLIALGTAWGLADDFMERSDYVLDPICGRSGYNHLSVRSAASIILDRILGDRI